MSAADFVDGQAKGRFAQKVVGQTVPEVPDGTDREDHLLSGERACLQIVVTGDDLFDGQTPAPKEFCRLLVAVGHDLSGRAELVHPRRPEGKNHAVGFAQGAGSCPAGQIHFRESHFLRTVRKSSVKTVVEPEPVAAAEFFGDDLLRRGVGFEGCSERKGVEQDAGGIARDPKPGSGQPARDVFGEAGSQRQQTVFIADPDGERRDSYFSAEFHAVKIDGNGVKRKFPTGSFFERKTEEGAGNRK